MINREVIQNINKHTEDIKNLGSSLETKANELTNEINIVKNDSATRVELSVERKRIDTFTSLAQGSTTGDAELTDGRISNNGIAYKNIGGHIRSKIDNIEKTIDIDSYYKAETITLKTGVIDKWNTLNSTLGKHFEYIVNAGDIFKITGYVYNSSYPLILEYDTNGNIINSIKSDVNDTQITDYSYTVTNGNVAKIIVNGYLTLGLKKLYKKTIKTSINEISTNITDDKIKENNEYVAIKLYNNKTVTMINGVYSTGGQITGIGKHCVIDVVENEEYLISGYVYNSSYPLILKRLNGTIVGYEKNDLSDSSVTDYYYKIPSGVNSLIINSNNVAIVKKKEIVNTKDYIDNITPKSFWSSKKIAWFGTSIPAGGYVGLNNANSYPMMIGGMLGATVYNEAIGSSSMCCRKKSQITSSNPYGFNGNYEQVSRCLTNTIEEMQWVIDNWNSSIWTSNNPSSKPTGTTATQILDNSYENKLMRRLGDGRCDLYVIDHGHNEVWESEALQQPSEIYDRSMVQGAFNFIIGKILEDNPKARIILVGEYEDQRNPWVKQVQTVCSDFWNLPIIPLWDMTGFSQKTINGKTILNTWMPDNIHPHSDTTGHCLRYLTNIIGNYIDKNIRL